MMNKLLVSRKFWTALLAEIAVFFKAPPFSEVNATTQVYVIAGVAIAFILGTAIESGLQSFGKRA